MDAIKLLPGVKITQAGVYDLTMDEYHGQPCAAPSISSSGLRTIWSESPAHYYNTSALNPANWVEEEVDGELVSFFRPEGKDQPHFTLGRAAHHLLFLGRKGFDEEFVQRPAKWDSFRTKEAKAWKLRMLRSGRSIITDTDLQHITGMARSLAAHPLVKAGILDGAVERSLLWPHRVELPAGEATVFLKSRPDCIPNDSGDFADLKTTTSVATDDLRRAIAEYQYPMQGGLVGMASRAVLGREMESFTLVFVEKTPPYCCRVVTLQPHDLARAEEQINHAARVFAECTARGVWPGPGGEQQDAEFLSVPDWAVKQDEARLALLEQSASYPSAAE